MSGRRVLRDTCGPVTPDKGKQARRTGWTKPPRHRLSDYMTARAPRIEVSR